MKIPSCPYLPKIDRVWRAGDFPRLKQGSLEELYLARLCYAQSLWLEGKPGQALLQLNKAFSLKLPAEHPVLIDWKPPYLAKAWVMKASIEEGGFIGNPVRHYQHLATRMSGENGLVRIWRAWACLHVAEAVNGEEWIRDDVQIEKENLLIPEKEEVASRIESLGWQGEASEWVKSFRLSQMTGLL
ncbi:MAG: hypothetical protein Q7Q71_11660 [Verrucomicrobiota bacterium JB023]|nr:hypothetical protein [Verrucomicrobiota bacterium JB023]